MTPDESLAYLYSLQQFGIKLGLRNIRELLCRLGNPEAGLRCIHVAGTNGKGSTVAYMRAALEADGKRVHVYTSPHLVNFRERIRLGAAGGCAREN